MKNENRRKKGLLTVSAAISIVAAACVACFAFAGFNSDKFGRTYTLEDYELKEFSCNADEYLKLSIDVESTDVEVIATDSNQIKISFYNMDKDYYTVSTAAGEIKMTHTNELESELVGFIFGYSIPKKTVTVELPKTVSLDMDYSIKYGDATFYNISTEKEFKITTDSAEAALQNITSSKMNIETKYGEVKLNDVKVNTSLTINGSEARFHLNNIDTGQFVFYNKEGKLNMEKIQSETVTCDTDSVTVKFTEMDSNNISMTAMYGSITGSFVGKSNDYTVISSVKDGENNLSDFKGNGSKTISIEADSASANISFTE